MASSFYEQIPAIVHLITKLSPKKVLDIGKGFGKYGFLIHEYVGINNSKKLNPGLSMREQSNVEVDCVEVDPDLFLPHLNLFYTNIFNGDISKLYNTFGIYDLILMIDVVEHIEKDKVVEVIQYFLSKGSKIIVATPKHFFQQDLYESEYENHVSHWTKEDFKKLGHVEYQYIGAGAVYLLSNEKINIRGYGSTFIKKIRRIGRVLRDELT